MADVTDVAATTDAVRRLAEGFGRVDWLHFNPSAFRQKDPLSLTAAELLTDVGLGVGALLTALQAVQPFLQPGGRVTATGSMAADKPWNEAASLGVQKAGLRNLVRSIDTTLEPARRPRRVADRARHAGQGGPVHPRPGRRRDLGRRPPGRVRLADRGALHRLTLGYDGSPADRAWPKSAVREAPFAKDLKRCQAHRRSGCTALALGARATAAARSAAPTGSRSRSATIAAKPASASAGSSQLT